MKASELLDHYEHDFHSLMDRDDKILWSGEPGDTTRIPLFNLDKDKFEGPSILSAGPSTMIFFWLGISGMYIYKFIAAGNYFYAILLAFVTIFVMMIPNILMKLRQKKTAYAVTKKGLLFKLWWYGKTRYEVIDWADVVSIKTTMLDDGSGTIHFMSNTNVQFFTYDFTKGKRRFNPTFEDIADVEYWADEFRQIKKQARLKRAH